MSSGQVSYGHLYGVGVGPGDPELLTLKAQRILQQVPIICVPQAETSTESYSLSIVQGFLDRDKQEILRIPFPTDDEEGAGVGVDRPAERKSRAPEDAQRHRRNLSRSRQHLRPAPCVKRNSS